MSSFLTPLRNAPADGFLLRNIRTGFTVADRLLPAFDSRARNVGLLRHMSMPPMSAMIIAPTSAIHTCFMKFAIDVAFVARDGRVVKTSAAVPPWRFSVALRAYAVVELPAGALARSDTVRGDTLEVVPMEDPPIREVSRAPE